MFSEIKPYIRTALVGVLHVTAWLALYMDRVRADYVSNALRDVVVARGDGFASEGVAAKEVKRAVKQRGGAKRAFGGEGRCGRYTQTDVCGHLELIVTENAAGVERES